MDAEPRMRDAQLDPSDKEFWRGGVTAEPAYIGSCVLHE